MYLCLCLPPTGLDAFRKAGWVVVEKRVLLQKAEAAQKENKIQTAAHETRTSLLQRGRAKKTNRTSFRTYRVQRAFCSSIAGGWWHVPIDTFLLRSRKQSNVVCQLMIKNMELRSSADHMEWPDLSRTALTFKRKIIDGRRAASVADQYFVVRLSIASIKGHTLLFSCFVL